jgi:hypothetical protein
MSIKLDVQQAPSYRASWAPVFLEPIMGSGERLTVAILVSDAAGREVKRTVRDEVLKALYGSKRGHLSQMIDFVLAALRSQGGESDPTIPLTGFSLGAWQEASSRAERYGVWRQAVYRSCSMASLDDLDAQEDETSAQEGTKQWQAQVRQSVVERRPELANSFNRDVQLISNGLPPRIGFLHEGKAANFATLRPNGISVSVGAARGKLYELVMVKREGTLTRGAVILGAPREDDLMYSEKALQAATRAIAELKHEASEDGLELVPAHSVPEAADQVLALAA